MTVVYRKSLVIGCGGYPDIHLKEDYALWGRMICDGARVSNMDEVLVDATAGLDMYRRRGGWRYVRSEIKLQIYLVRFGIKTVIEALVTGIFRSCIFILPATFRGNIYRIFLRTNESNEPS